MIKRQSATYDATNSYLSTGGSQDADRKKGGSQASLGSINLDASTKQAMDEQQKQLDRIEAAKRFSEMNRLQSAINLNSTLEEAQTSQYIDAQENDQKELEDLIIAATELGGNKSLESSDSSGWFNAKIFDQSRRSFLGHIYKFNHVLLDYQALSRVAYHLILLIEFVQLLYYAFYNYTFVIEFAKANTADQTASDSSNSTASEGAGNSTHKAQSASINLSIEGEFTASNSFKIDSYLMWANFDMYALDQKSVQGYLVIYATLTAIFYVLMGFLFTMANKLFRLSMSDEIKDSTQFAVKGCSIIMGLYLFLFQMPFQATLFQGYLCDEELTLDTFILPGVACNGLNHQILQVISSITLIAYFAFLYIQSHLYNSSNLETTLAWTSLDRELPVFRVMWKLLIGCCFIFDKAQKLSDYTKIAIGGVGAFIAIKRLSYALILDKSVYLAASFYDLCISQIFLHLALNKLGNFAITVNKLFYTLTMTMFFSIAAILIAERFRSIQIYKEKSRVGENIQAKSPMMAQHVIHKMLKLIRSKGPTENVIMNGLIINHFEQCVQDACVCQELIMDFDSRVYQFYNQQEIVQAEHARRLRARYLREDLDEGAQQQNQQLYSVKRDLAERQDSLGKTGADDDQKNFGRKSSKLDATQDTIRYSVNLDVEISALNNNHGSKPSNQPFHPVIGHSTTITNLPDLQSMQHQSNSALLHQVLEIPSQLNSAATDNLVPPKDVTHSLNVASIKHSQLQGAVPPTAAKANGTTQPVSPSKLLSSNSNMGGSTSTPFEGITTSKLKTSDDGVSNISRALTQGLVDNRQIQSKQYLDLIDEAQIEKYERNLRYRFLVLYVDKAIKTFPKSVDLRIHSSNIHCFKLDNEFKATFELMKCERDLPQNFQTRFFLFRRRLLIERNLFERSQSYVSQGNSVNSYSVYNFEKLYQRFTKFSYLSANSALNFWRELLKKNIESQVLIDRGSEISRIHTKIKEIANEIIRINPNDIKFLLSYATFLWQIVHIEQEAQFVFDKAFSIFQRLPTNGSGSDISGGVPAQSTDKGDFGQNSAVSIVIVALSAEEVGRIIHVSDEMQRALGHKRQNLIGKNISNITPTPIAIVHDRFLTNFLETAKSTMLNQSRQLFAMTADGYLRPIQVLLQLYPQMQERITILGFIQTIEKLDGIVPPKSVDLPEEIFHTQTHHYLMTDKCGNVNCISEGLKDIGLNSKFFMISNSKFKSLNIESLFNLDFTLPETYELLMSEGVVTQIDTSNILEHVNIESISQEETMQAIERQGIYNIHIQLKRYIFDARFSVVDLYRIILLPANPRSWQGGVFDYDQKSHKRNSIQENKDSNAKESVAPPSQSYSDSKLNISSMSSASSRSSQSSKVSYSTVIQEFKNAIGQRSTPRHLKKLNWILIFIVIMTITCSSIDYSLKLGYLESETAITDLLVHSQSRSVRFVQLMQNIRSFINIANNLEFSQYSDPKLGRFDRFDFMKTQIMNQATEVYGLMNYFSQQRSQYDSGELTNFESAMISAYRMTSAGDIVDYDLHFKMAFDMYLNKIFQFNSSQKADLMLQDFIIKSAPFIDAKYLNISNMNVSRVEQDVSFMLLNGIRIILYKTHEVEDYLHKIVTELSLKQDKTEFLLIMLAGLTLVTTMMVLIVQKIANTDRSNKEILSIFALLSIDEIDRIYGICDKFIDRLDNHELQTRKQNSLEDYGEANSLTSRDDDEDNALVGKKKKGKSGLKDMIVIEHITHNQIGSTQGLISNPGQDERWNEEFKEGDEDSRYNDSSMLNVSHNQGKIRNPISRKQKFQISRREYYSLMIQRALSIMKEEEQFQEKVQMEREQLQAEIEKFQKGRVTKDKMRIFGLSRRKGRNKYFDDGQKRRDDSQKNRVKISKKEHSPPRKAKNESKKENTLDVKAAKRNKRQLPGSKKKKKDHSEKVDPDSSRRNLKGADPDISADYDDSISSQLSDRADGDQSADFDMAEGDKKINKKKNPLSPEDEQMKAEIDFYEQRKAMLRTISQDRVRKCWNTVILSFIFLLSFFAYFFYAYFYHAQSLETLNLIQKHSPSFFKRFEHISLQYQFIREKIVAQVLDNKLMDFRLPANPIMTTTSDGQPIPIGMYYHEVSMQGEGEIQRLKTQNPSYLGPLLRFVNLLDTDQFCETIFNINAIQLADNTNSISKLSTAQLQKILAESYTVEVGNDIPIILALQQDNMERLMQLKAQGYNFGNPDYDYRYPLHIASHRGNFEIVKFLVGTGIDLSPVDRWGVTPLSEAAQFPEIFNYLKNAGAKLGKPRENFVSQKVVLTDNQYRLFFAAFYNDIPMMNALKQIGWDVNVKDRTNRTPLQVAASEGNVEAVLRLLASGANLANIDARGSDALDDAIREKQAAIVELLIEKALLKEQCKSFENSLFSKGFSSTIGVFNRKFQDVQITLEDTPNKKNLFALLGAAIATNSSGNASQGNQTQQTSNNNKTNATKPAATPSAPPANTTANSSESGYLSSQSDTTQRVMQVFFSSQELYIRQVINRQEQILLETYQLYSDSYKNVAQIVFFIFLIVQLFALLFMRRRFIENLKEEVIHSRGILNLVPERFFRENQNEVEKVIKMITR